MLFTDQGSLLNLLSSLKYCVCFVVDFVIMLQLVSKPVATTAIPVATLTSLSLVSILILFIDPKNSF